MYDNRCPNLSRMSESGAPRDLLRAVDDVCRRCGLSAAFDRSGGCVFFHLPNEVMAGVWREDVLHGSSWARWDTAKVDQVCRITNTRKMPRLLKEAEMRQAESDRKHAIDKYEESDDESFNNDAVKLVKYRRNHRGMHKGYRQSVVVKPGD